MTRDYTWFLSILQAKARIIPQSDHILFNSSFTDHASQSELLTASSNYKYRNKNLNIITIARSIH
jgi:hypothetical protein